MKEFWITVQVMFSAVGGWLGWFLGGCDGLLYALLAFGVIDYPVCLHRESDPNSEFAKHNQAQRRSSRTARCYSLRRVQSLSAPAIVNRTFICRTKVLFSYGSKHAAGLREVRSRLRRRERTCCRSLFFAFETAEGVWYNELGKSKFVGVL